MANQIMKLVIQFRRDLAANWELHKDVVPAAGEPCFETDTGVFKIGDGVRTYGELKAIGGANLDADGKSIVITDGMFKLAGFDAAEVGAQPRKNADGNIEWVVPSTETVEGLQTTVAGLQSDIKTIQEIVTPSGEGKQPLLDRVQTLEEQLFGTGEDSIDKRIDAKINEFAAKVTDDGTINTIQELVNYVAEHGGEVATMAADIAELKTFVGNKSVSDQINEAISGSGHITEIAVNGTILDVVDGKVNITIPEFKGSDEIVVAEDGTLSIGTISFDKIVQREDSTLVLDGGASV